MNGQMNDDELGVRDEGGEMQNFEENEEGGYMAKYL
jgi:hypothetical protein